MGERYTVEEIRAAIERARTHVFPVADDVMAELTRPAIHPSVPVLYHSGYHNVDVNFASQLDDEDTNIRVLIPAPLSKKMLLIVVDASGPMRGLAEYQTVKNNMMEHFESLIAHYTAHGLGEKK